MRSSSTYWSQWSVSEVRVVARGWSSNSKEWPEGLGGSQDAVIGNLRKWFFVYAPLK